jgi:hypothetical protein
LRLLGLRKAGLDLGRSECGEGIQLFLILDHGVNVTIWSLIFGLSSARHEVGLSR